MVVRRVVRRSSQHYYGESHFTEALATFRLNRSIERSLPFPGAFSRGIASLLVARPPSTAPTGSTSVPSPVGLVPIGNTGLYMTPTTPADPTDCVRWPSSPFCGGSPISLLPIGFEPEFINNECDVGITLTPVLARIRSAPISIVYRRPNCRVTTTAILRPPREPLREYRIPFGSCYGETIEIRYSGVMARTPESIYRESLPPDNPLYIQPEDRLFGNTAVFVTKTLIIPRYLDYTIFVSKGTGDIFSDQTRLRGTDRIELRFAYATINGPDLVNQTIYHFPYNFFANTSSEEYTLGDWKIESISCRGLIVPPPPPILRRTEEEEMGCCDLVAAILRKVNALDTKVVELNTKVVELDAKVDDLDQKLGEFPLAIEIYDEKENQVDAQNKTLFVNDLAKAIQITAERVEVANKIIGIEEYPASLPASLISKDEGFIGNLIPNADVSIPNLTKLIGWQIERFDEVVGQFEIPIEIKDSDPTTPGDQPVGVKLPNIAESIAEMFLLIFQTSVDVQTLVNMTTRTMVENGQDKQQNYITYRLLQSLVDWAGYKTKEHSEKLPMLFDPGKSRFDELLQETEVNVSITEFDDKHGLEADLMRFRKAASILDSVYFRKVNPFGNIREQLMQTVRDKLNLVNNISGDDDNTFAQFLEEVEEGFGNVPGVDNPLYPYGREFADRPRVRDLTNRTPPTNPAP